MKKKLIINKEDNKMNIDEESENREKTSNIKSKIKNGDDLWRVGIICKKECYYLTQENLKILEKNGYEWKRYFKFI